MHACHDIVPNHYGIHTIAHEPENANKGDKHSHTYTHPPPPWQSPPTWSIIIISIVMYTHILMPFWCYYSNVPTQSIKNTIILAYFSLMHTTHELVLASPFLHFLQTMLPQLEQFTAKVLLHIVLSTSPQQVHFSCLPSVVDFCSSWYCLPCSTLFFRVLPKFKKKIRSII